MVLLDDFNAPGGLEQVTKRPVWRVRMDDGRVLWAYVQERNGKIWISGYPRYQVDAHHRKPEPAAGLVVGAGAGALIGGALGGPPGALVGGILGALFGAGGGTSGRS